MKKKLSVVRSQQKITTGQLPQPTTHKLLSQSKHKKGGLVGLRNKENDAAKPSIDVRCSDYDRPTTLVPCSVGGASSTSTLLRERFDKSVRERLGESRDQSKKLQPSVEKFSTVTPKYNSITSHREPSHRKQFTFAQNQHSNSQKPNSGSARGKRFSSIRRSEVQATLGTEELKSQKPQEPSLSKNDKKESVWGKRQLVLTSERQRRPLKDSTSAANITPATAKEKNSLSKFCTQLPPPKTILTVSSYSNLFSGQHQPHNHYYISTLIEAFSDRSNNTSFMQLTRNHLLMTLQVLNITKNVERPSSSHPQLDSSRQTQSCRNTLVFDLDETLIHCNQSTEVPHDVLLNITFPNGDSTKAGVNIRPFAIQTLKQLSEVFDLVIFTASHECYANVVVDYLDPKGTLIKGRYFRDSCFRTPEGLYIKDLRVLNRPLDKLILIDNAAYSYAFQLDNGVPVIPFYDDKTDMELRQLCHYLKPMAQSRDIRKDNSQYFKTRHYLNFADPLELIRTLYGGFLQNQQ